MGFSLGAQNDFAAVGKLYVSPQKQARATHGLPSGHGDTVTDTKQVSVGYALAVQRVCRLPGLDLPKLFQPRVIDRLHRDHGVRVAPAHLDDFAVDLKNVVRKLGAGVMSPGNGWQNGQGQRGERDRIGVRNAGSGFHDIPACSNRCYAPIVRPYGLRWCRARMAHPDGCFRCRQVAPGDWTRRDSSR